MVRKGLGKGRAKNSRTGQSRKRVAKSLLSGLLLGVGSIGAFALGATVFMPAVAYFISDMPDDEISESENSPPQSGDAGLPEDDDNPSNVPSSSEGNSAGEGPAILSGEPGDTDAAREQDGIANDPVVTGNGANANGNGNTNTGDNAAGPGVSSFEGLSSGSGADGVPGNGQPSETGLVPAGEELPATNESSYPGPSPDPVPSPLDSSFNRDRPVDVAGPYAELLLPVDLPPDSAFPGNNIPVANPLFYPILLLDASEPGEPGIDEPEQDNPKQDEPGPGETVSFEPGPSVNNNENGLLRLAVFEVPEPDALGIMVIALLGILGVRPARRQS